MSRLGSLRDPANKGKYDKLEDEESRPGRQKLKEVEEADEPIGYDLSGYDGTPMKKFEPRAPKKPLSAADSMQQEHDLHEAGYAAEFERLEAQLGAGMSAIHEIPFTHKPASDMNRSHHNRGPSGVEIVGAGNRKDAQREAEKTGDIVAVSGEEATDRCDVWIF